VKDPDGPSRKVVGTKQVLRALKCNQVEKVYIASDADESVKLSVIDFCSKLKITTEEVNTMYELGCEFQRRGCDSSYTKGKQFSIGLC